MADEKAAAAAKVEATVESVTVGLQAAVDAEDTELAALIAAEADARAVWSAARKALNEARDPGVTKARELLAQLQTPQQQRLAMRGR